MHATIPPSNRQRARRRAARGFAWWAERLVAAERGEGWLAECDRAGRFLAVSRELVDALAKALRGLCGDGGGPVLEVCAGSGELAGRLAAAGARLQATDIEPPEGSQVLPLSAREALRRFQPAVVLGAFVPHDAGVDEAVLACPSVEHYVVLGARIGGLLGSPPLWTAAGFGSRPREDIARWMLTRHDVWLGGARLLRHGEAWHFARRPAAG